MELTVICFLGLIAGHADGHCQLAYNKLAVGSFFDYILLGLVNRVNSALGELCRICSDIGALRADGDFKLGICGSACVAAHGVLCAVVCNVGVAVRGDCNVLVIVEVDYIARERDFNRLAVKAHSGAAFDCYRILGVCCAERSAVDCLGIGNRHGRAVPIIVHGVGKVVAARIVQLDFERAVGCDCRRGREGREIGHAALLIFLQARLVGEAVNRSGRIVGSGIGLAGERIRVEVFVYAFQALGVVVHLIRRSVGGYPQREERRARAGDIVLVHGNGRAGLVNRAAEILSLDERHCAHGSARPTEEHIALLYKIAACGNGYACVQGVGVAVNGRGACGVAVAVVRNRALNGERRGNVGDCVVGGNIGTAVGNNDIVGVNADCLLADLRALVARQRNSGRGMTLGQTRIGGRSVNGVFGCGVLVAVVGVCFGNCPELHGALRYSQLAFVGNDERNGEVFRVVVSEIVCRDCAVVYADILALDFDRVNSLEVFSRVERIARNEGEACCALRFAVVNHAVAVGFNGHGNGELLNLNPAVGHGEGDVQVGVGIAELVLVKTHIRRADLCARRGCVARERDFGRVVQIIFARGGVARYGLRVAVICLGLGVACYGNGYVARCDCHITVVHNDVNNIEV